MHQECYSTRYLDKQDSIPVNFIDNHFQHEAYLQQGSLALNLSKSTKICNLSTNQSTYIHQEKGLYMNQECYSTICIYISRTVYQGPRQQFESGWANTSDNFGKCCLKVPLSSKFSKKWVGRGPPGPPANEGPAVYQSVLQTSLTKYPHGSDYLQFKNFREKEINNLVDEQGLNLKKPRKGRLFRGTHESRQRKLLNLMLDSENREE